MKEIESIHELNCRYKKFCDAGFHINMERGWPCKEQLELSMPMLDLVTSETNLDREMDYRGYAGTGGIEPLKHLFGNIFEVDPEQIYIGGTMSTSIMYDIVSKAMMFGFDSYKPWKDYSSIKFICPVPGYEKHFKICSTFGIEMIPISMDNNGPDMDEIEKIVASDEFVKGIWCVPLYSNPTGTIYSDEVVTRMASMKTKADDFRIFWDNAYFAHHLSDEPGKIKNIIHESKKFGFPNRVFEFASTSKITFPGGGVGLCISSIENIRWLTKASLLQLKSGDKINQLRHYFFLKDENGLKEHMLKHRQIIKPKFDLVDQVLHEELDGWNIAWWQKPKGGYFFCLKVEKNMAGRIWKKCKNAGVKITPAGSIFPYGRDPEDSYLRLAPTYPSVLELETAIRVLCVCIKLCYLENRETEENKFL